MIEASLKNYRQSPRKVRLVANSIRGKKVVNAITKLSFTPKKASLPLVKLLESAVANAKNNFGVESDNLIIKSITVDEGYTLKRWRPRARGAAFPINKRTSHVKVVLADKDGKDISLKKAKKTTKKATSSKKSSDSSVKKEVLPKAPKVEKKSAAARGNSAAHKTQAPRTTNK